MARSKRGGKKQSGDGWSVTKTCERCGREESRCGCASEESAASPAARVRLRLERRRGKQITCATAEGIDPTEWRSVAKEIKGRLSTGGTVKDDFAEFQGDHRETVRALFQEHGFVVR